MPGGFLWAVVSAVAEELANIFEPGLAFAVSSPGVADLGATLLAWLSMMPCGVLITRLTRFCIYSLPLMAVLILGGRFER